MHETMKRYMELANIKENSKAGRKWKAMCYGLNAAALGWTQEEVRASDEDYTIKAAELGMFWMGLISSNQEVGLELIEAYEKSLKRDTRLWDQFIWAGHEYDIVDKKSGCYLNGASCMLERRLGWWELNCNPLPTRDSWPNSVKMSFELLKKMNAINFPISLQSKKRWIDWFVESKWEEKEVIQMIEEWGLNVVGEPDKSEGIRNVYNEARKRVRDEDFELLCLWNRRIEVLEMRNWDLEAWTFSDPKKETKKSANRRKHQVGLLRRGWFSFESSLKVFRRLEDALERADRSHEIVWSKYVEDPGAREAKRGWWDLACEMQGNRVALKGLTESVNNGRWDEVSKWVIHSTQKSPSIPRAKGDSQKDWILFRDKIEKPREDHSQWSWEEWAEGVKELVNGLRKKDAIEVSWERWVWAMILCKPRIKGQEDLWKVEIVQWAEAMKKSDGLSRFMNSDEWGSIDENVRSWGSGDLIFLKKWEELVKHERKKVGKRSQWEDQIQRGTWDAQWIESKLLNPQEHPDAWGLAMERLYYENNEEKKKELIKSVGLWIDAGWSWDSKGNKRTVREWWESLGGAMERKRYWEELRLSEADQERVEAGMLQQELKTAIHEDWIDVRLSTKEYESFLAWKKGLNQSPLETGEGQQEEAKRSTRRL